MREKILYALVLASALLMSYNLYNIFVILPDEANQGAIYRIIFYHVPAAITAFTGAFVAMVASILYLVRRELKYDAFAAAIIEVSLVFGIVNLVTGSIWGRVIWGIWWTWDFRLTSMLVFALMYAAYLMLRQAVEEPAQRARLSAVLSVFAFVDVIIVWKSIEWFRTQHPGPVLSIRSGGGMAPGMERAIYLNLLAILLLAAGLVIVRMRQDEVQNELDSMRRQIHAQ